MEKGNSSFDLILKSLVEKGPAKIEVFHNTEEVFRMMKTILQQLESQIQKAMETVDNRVVVKFTERGPFDLEFKISDDIIIYTLHSDSFTFPKSHQIWKSSYVNKAPKYGYFGIISVYNFITDSIKYNRLNDMGLLIARVFVNFERHFFVEGKKQLGMLYNDIENDVLVEDRIRHFLENTILHSLNFDIHTPPFDQVQIISVQDLQTKNISTLVSTGKRLGFKLQSDTNIE